VKTSERHKLKHDLYADNVMKAALWAKRHRTRILTVAAAALLVAAAVVWIALARQEAENSAADLLAEVEAQANAIARAKDDKKAAAIKEVVAKCDLIAADYPESRAAPIALCRAAQVYAEAGRASEATPYFRRTIAESRGRAGLVDVARRGLAESLEDSGKLREAIEQYRLLLRDDATAAEVNWDIGRCYDQLNEPEQAETHYKKAVQLGSDTVWGELAQAALARLANPAPAETPPPPKQGAPKPPAEKPAAKKPGPAPAPLSGAPATERPGAKP